jgi:RND family efflux transporter MFP subunit
MVPRRRQWIRRAERGQPRRLCVASVLVTLGAALAACGDRSVTPPAARAAVHVGTVAAARRPMARSYEASGTVRGRNTAVLTSRVMADVREVRVVPGDLVSAGQLLVVLDDADVQAARRRARAALEEAAAGRHAAESAVRAADAAASVAGVTHERNQKLLDAQVIPRQEYDESEARQRGTAAEREAAQARLLGGAARVAEAQAALAGAEAAASYTRIAAPFAGRVIERRVDPGSQASPGLPLLVLEQDGLIRVEAAFDESRAPSLEVGDTARIDLEAVAEEVDGRVAEIVPAVDPTSRSFTVKFELPSAVRGALRPGMYARVRVPLGSVERLTVPVSAVAAAGQLDRVFVVEGGRAHLRLVTLGTRQDDVVEVLSGLSAGERVVERVPPGLRGGDAIEVDR